MMTRTLIKRAAGTLALVLFCGGPVVARPLDEVIASKTLKVVAYLDNAPFSWEQDGKPVGIDVDIGKALARELSVEPEIILRLQGEKEDDDLRGNVWKGPLTGGGVGDVMLHVPTDREFALRNKEAVIGNAYFQEQIAVFIDPERVPETFDFTLFKKEKIGVQIATVADYFLMTYEDGALIDNILHYVKQPDGVKRFLAKEMPALMGIRSNLEGLFHAKNIKAKAVQPAMPGIVRSDWVIGMAWKDNSRDLGYALQAGIEKIKNSGELERIFTAYGVTYVPPPAP
jgi:polar amino acid transport system substrate-binding protein